MSRDLLVHYWLDIDECDEDHGGCEHECVNTPGSYQCRCSGGFELREDGRTCRPLSSTAAAGTLSDNSTVSEVMGPGGDNETEPAGPRCQASCDHVTRLEQKVKRLEEKITAMGTAIKLYSFASGPPGPEGGF